MVQRLMLQSGLAPQLFEPRRIRCRVANGVLNVAVAQVVLNQPLVGPLIGQDEAATVRC